VRLFVLDENPAQLAETCVLDVCERDTPPGAIESVGYVGGINTKAGKSIFYNRSADRLLDLLQKARVFP
jgi:hypothetical protein